MEQTLDNVRNFCIIAHVDHGKTTLSDRILELTKAVPLRELKEQTLDAMDLERERGITIKSHPVSMMYKSEDGKEYLFNLIDTPGHVDFAYEVSRSMGACEGAVLVVDAAQGVEAQTVANTYFAQDAKLEIVPVLNKVDLPGADVKGVSQQIEDILAIPMDDPLLVSAKTGVGCPAVLEAIVKRIPPPKTRGADAPLRALVFDSVFDEFRGVITYVRIVDGSIAAGDSVKFMASGVTTTLHEVGIFSPSKKPCERLSAGQVGYLVGTVKDPEDIKIGDTVTTARLGSEEPLPGFKELRPTVFCGIYPMSTDEFEKVHQGLEKLHLNDSAFTFHHESSLALGFGFRCGFLGLLHMEIVQERLRREFNLDIISTTPGVIYKLKLKSGEERDLDNPQQMPDPSVLESISEPILKARIITPSESIGDVMRIVMDRRGQVEGTETVDAHRVMLHCMLPLNEILLDFHDTLKSVSHGYASMDYEPAGYQVSDIVKMDILLNSETVDAFATMVHRSKARARGQQMCKALADTIPQHMFKIPVQAAIGREIIAREDIKPFRKDVLAKLYGGDVTRKMKVLEKQKRGKARMKEFGHVNVPQSAFIAVLKGTVKESRRLGGPMEKLFNVDEGKCVKCGACVRDCAFKALRMREGGGPEMAWPERCMRCQHCLAVCPVGAVEFDGRRPEDSVPRKGLALPSAEAVENWLRTRRSVRRFSGTSDVDRATLDRILKVLGNTPTGCNARALTFTCIPTREAMDRFKGAFIKAIENHRDGNKLLPRWLAVPAIRLRRGGEDMFFRGAPGMLIVSSDETVPGVKTPREDVTIACSNFELLANANGISTCWCGFLNLVQKEVPELLEATVGLRRTTPFYAMLFGVGTVAYPRGVQRDGYAKVSYMEDGLAN